LRSDEIPISDGEGERVSDEGSDNRQTTQFHYHLELTPTQLKITHTALRSLLDDFGHDEREVLRIIHEVLEKLPDQHAIRAIQLDQEVERQLTGGEGAGDEPPPAAA
jgi:hypothetical protein